MLTDNEKQVLRLLAANPAKNHSINEVARACKMAPNGAFKLLAKLEKEGVLKAKPIANIKAYALDFDSGKTVHLLELAFMHDALEGRIKSRADDLRFLQPVTIGCVLFGSYITTKKEPGDLDALFVLEQKNFKAYRQALSKAQDFAPVKIQDIVQTGADLEKNLRKGNPIVTEALRNGIVLWGFEMLVQLIKNAHG